MVSVTDGHPEIGPAGRPASVASGSGLPAEIIALTLVVPFNDVAALERTFDEHRDSIAGLIMKPVMMNAGSSRRSRSISQGSRALCTTMVHCLPSTRSRRV
ncbi:hypothetical protein BH20ACT22_BH20ACT22_16130 [soil metagenome]